MQHAYCLLFAWMLSQVVMNAALAQLPQVNDSRIGLDMVRLGGKRVYGFVLSERHDRSLQMAVERSWLRQHHPQLYEQRQALERQQLTRARDQLETRISDWMEDRQGPDDDVLQRFLQSQLSRIQNSSIKEQSKSRFMLLVLERSDLREIKLQQPDSRHIAGLAYQFGLDDVVTTPANMLELRLIEQGIDPESEVVDLSDQVPAWQLQSDRQWAAKKALVEYQLREALDYQGTSNNMMRKSAVGVDVGALVGTMLGTSQFDAIGQLGAELGLPEFKQFSAKQKSDWSSKITREAEAEGFIGVQVTRLEQNLLSPLVTVETTFLARDQPGSWFVVFKTSASENANAQPADRVREIKEDPQIKMILDTLAQLGLVLADRQGGDRLEQALRHGVATERALGRAQGEFNSFLVEQIRILDGFPVKIQAVQADRNLP